MGPEFKAEILSQQLSDIEVAAELAEAQVREHLTALEQLEATYGFDAEAYGEVYPGALDGRSEASRLLLAKWQALYEGLADDSATVAVYSVGKTLAPGCNGFGKEAEYIYTEAGFVVDGPATVSFVRKEKPDELNKSPYVIEIELSGNIFAAGFSDSNGAVPSILLASSDFLSDWLYERKPRFDEEATVLAARSGSEFWVEASKTERNIRTGRLLMNYNRSDLLALYSAATKVESAQ